MTPESKPVQSGAPLTVKELELRSIAEMALIFCISVYPPLCSVTWSYFHQKRWSPFLHAMRLFLATWLALSHETLPSMTQEEARAAHAHWQLSSFAELDWPVTTTTWTSLDELRADMWEMPLKLCYPSGRPPATRHSVILFDHWLTINARTSPANTTWSRIELRPHPWAEPE